MICGSNDSSLRRDLGGDYLSENLKLWFTDSFLAGSAVK